jgi:hypothetical protein
MGDLDEDLRPFPVYGVCQTPESQYKPVVIDPKHMFKNLPGRMDIGELHVD